MALRGGMMDVPLLVSAILRHAAAFHGDAPVVSRDASGAVHRTGYAEVAERAGRLAQALAGLGLTAGDRVGTLAWNGFRHLEAYYAISGSGLVCHTINPRLFPEQILGIIRHARDRALLVDPFCVPLLEGLAPLLGALPPVIVLADEPGTPAGSALPLLCYETLVAAQEGGFDWPLLDEHVAAGLCYTSGTTGDPKGVLYSHRSIVLHALSSALPDVFDLSASAVVMPVVPMFHVNAWGLPYSVPMVGAKLVLPGMRLDGESLHGLIAAEGVTHVAGVPTVWGGLLDWAAERGASLAPLRRAVIGGSACPPVMMQRFAEHGVEVVHAWGMTETSPLGLANRPKASHRGEPAEAALARQAKQGRPMFGVEFRIVNDAGQDQPRDGKNFGALLVRGPWVAAHYHALPPGEAHAHAGWFATGDVATMDADGYVEIVDRTKDVIKSGGEWISSIALENIACAHPAVREAAVIGRPDERWSERPLLLLVLRPGQEVTPAEMQAYFTGKVAKWWIPEDVRIVEDLPHTATGKLQKTRIRELYL